MRRFFRIDDETFEQQASSTMLPCLNADAARRLGDIAINIASRRGLAVAVSVVSARAPLFYCALDGSGAEDCETIRRKQNTVFRFGRSSLEVGIAFARDGLSLRSEGLSGDDYALEGGGVPLRVAATELAGAMTIAGLDSVRNHELAVESIRWYVGSASLMRIA
ncbi:heme-binding protein [Burkholderia sp. Ac-20353]|uniref:heme-binding protein n=1 Tax=Burkholderia sp. Ac-20353 TaxID=2703894 RepID=UPI00197C0512|nr:heme-binding protein [Burkholderia sp. Ac-20353]MBN3791165.1 heme-degrading domain-containing protein [Burkholderia sp. Ac-20353]